MATTTANTAVASYLYTLGAAGNRKSVAELSGRTVTYGYDDVYRLTLETIAGDLHAVDGAVGYTYDNVGNRLQMTSTLNPVPPGLWNYDANDRITTDTYDDNGNTVADAGTQNVYDFENHLIQRGSVTIVYDGDGNRVSETAGGVTTNYLVDNENPTGYAQVVDELQGGQVVRSYTWGHWLISQTQQINSTWKTSYYGYDGHGSVRFLTDTNGAITDTYDYDAFGNLIASTGHTPNNYLFAGEQFDPALNLYYNRARYLDVRTGRFWGMDTDEGDPEAPASLHKYLHVYDDPINQSDRTGHGIIDSVQSLSIQATLFVMSHPILTAVSTAVLVALAPEDLLNAIPPDFGGPELQALHAIEVEATELRTLSRLLKSANFLDKFKAGRDFERWMMTRILATVEKEAVQLVVREGEVVAGQARLPGSAVIDTIIKGVIYEFKTSFGAVKKYQAQQFAKYAPRVGGAIEYVFLHQPKPGEVEQLRTWIHEVDSGVRLSVTYILK